MNTADTVLVVALASFSCCPCPARAPLQQDPVPALPTAGVAATARFVYVLRGSTLYQLDAETLELRRRVELPAVTGAKATGAAVAAQPGAPTSVPVEVIENYQGRPAGRALLAKSGGAATARAVELGLAWLAAHQDGDGKWDADGFMKHDPHGQRTTGQGNAVHDIGVTGLALLAFLGDGSTMRSGGYKDVVKSGVRRLLDQQDPNNGLIGASVSNDYVYDHAIATLALCEAYGLSDYEILRSGAQRGINYLESHRNPYAVWRYQPRDGDNDTSVTSWALMAYRSAEDFGLDVNQNAMKLAAAWFDQMTDPVTGRTGYTERGGFSSRRAGPNAVRFPREHGEAMTAAALFNRLLLGQRPEGTVLVPSAELVAAKPPRWDVEGGAIDHIYWFFGTNAMYQMGGEFWKKWSDHLPDAVVANQRTGGSFAGSWDPAGAWGEEGGRVYSTALMVLTLEVWYRFARITK